MSFKLIIKFDNEPAMVTEHVSYVEALLFFTAELDRLGGAIRGYSIHKA